MSDVVQIAAEIQDRIRKLADCRRQIRERTMARASSMSAYSKSIAKVEIMLRMGKPIEIDGETIKDPPASILKDLAKGKCWKEEAEMIEADGMYRALLDSMKTLQAELNGLQSIFRHLDTT
jgi:hypothetical protein